MLLLHHSETPGTYPGGVASPNWQRQTGDGEPVRSRYINDSCSTGFYTRRKMHFENLTVFSIILYNRVRVRSLGRGLSKK